MNRFHVPLLVTFLVSIGLGLATYKWQVLGFPLQPNVRSTVWDLEAAMSFTALSKSVKLSLFIPANSSNASVLDENFISRGFGLTTKSLDNGNRSAEWQIRKAQGLQTLYYRATLRQMAPVEGAPAETSPRVIPPELDPSEFVAVESIITEVRDHTADTEGMVTGIVSLFSSDTVDDNVSLLLGRDRSIVRRAERAIEVLAQAGIAARLVHGFELKSFRRDAQIVQWIEFFDQGKWRAFDLAHRHIGVPDTYIEWWRGAFPLVTATGIRDLKTEITIRRNQEGALNAAIDQGATKAPRLIELSTFSLPLRSQAVYRILLTIPIGALFLVILRNIIGIKTFGTFMPVLIALAFRETELVWGSLLFGIIIAAGLLIRFYVGRLQLLLVPRLGAILVVVVLLMLALGIFSTRLGWDFALSIALFPMVILTMTIERMCLVWEEEGPSEAIQQVVGSIVSAAIAFLMMTNKIVEHLVFVFPELLFVLLAFMIVVGRYTGYRLTEVWRFKSLVEPT